MCGIAGIAAHAAVPDLGDHVAAMTATLRHRGPDGEDQWLAPEGRTALGHTRLSIVDLSPRGRQPMANEDETLWLSFNGEIYNWRALRADLERRGHRFRSNTDSEVILHLWEEEGEAALAQLHGMFAFLLYDTKSERLFAARDRVGKKPLVYAHWDGGVALASEIPALLQLPMVGRTLDPEAVALYLIDNMRHVPDPWTIYRDIRRLPAGHAMSIQGGAVERIWRYWHPPLVSRDTTPSQATAVLDHAVALRKEADVEVAVLLSGGVDSSAIAQSMVAAGAVGTRSYVLGRDAGDDELPRARAMADRLGTRHKEVLFDPDRHHDGLEELVARHGEPIALLPLVHTLQLCRAIQADGIKVVLTGHGADELFFGYSSHLQQALLSRIEAIVPAVIRPLWRVLARIKALPARLRLGALVLGAPAGHRRAALLRYSAEAVWPRLLNGPARPHPADLTQRWAAQLPIGARPRAYIDEAALTALLSENAPSVTIAGDLPAMAAGVETRSPFLDQDMVGLALATPFRRKVHRLFDPAGLKWILKQALRGRVPDALLFAPKRGFGTNIQESDLLAGSWRARVDQAFTAFDDLDGLLNADAARDTWRGFQAAPTARVAQIVFKLYVIQLWRRSMARG
ncbi:MAG: asparagine synthase (glutamine-hydrolyzing) [Alphaproteobacteria bacterium]